MLAMLHICTALRYKPTSTASVSFIYKCYMRTETFPLMTLFKLVPRERLLRHYMTEDLLTREWIHNQDRRQYVML